MKVRQTGPWLTDDVLHVCYTIKHTKVQLSKNIIFSVGAGVDGRVINPTVCVRDDS